MKRQADMEEKKWSRIANRIVGWSGIVLMVVVLVMTAGVDLYLNHFKLFVVTLCLLPVGFCIDRAISRWAKKTIAERLEAQPTQSALRPHHPELRKTPVPIITPAAARPGGVRVMLRRKRTRQNGQIRVGKSNRL